MDNKKVRISLCSADRMLMRALSNYILESGVADSCSVYQRGEHLLRDLEVNADCTGLVLDDVMRDMDALELLLRLQKLHPKQRPVVFVLSVPEVFCRVQKKVPDMVDVFLCKPVNPEILTERLRLFCADALEQSGTKLHPLLREWGTAVEQSQAEYFSLSVGLMERAGRSMALRKELLPAVAASCGVSVSAVDSGLRRMIRTLEETQSPEYLRFKVENGLGNQKPTVKKLLEICGKCMAERKYQKEKVNAGA